MNSHCPCIDDSDIPRRSVRMFLSKERPPFSIDCGSRTTATPAEEFHECSHGVDSLFVTHHDLSLLSMREKSIGTMINETADLFPAWRSAKESLWKFRDSGNTSYRSFRFLHGLFFSTSSYLTLGFRKTGQCLFAP